MCNSSPIRQLSKEHRLPRSCESTSSPPLATWRQMRYLLHVQRPLAQDQLPFAAGEPRDVCQHELLRVERCRNAALMIPFDGHRHAAE